MNTKTGRCYETHPPLPLGGGLVIYGGSCGYPAVEDADIYVGLDYSMKKSEKAYPWVPGESFLYPITDMNPPSDADSFKQLIEWLAVQLSANKKVHVGCIGGHGRTGTVFAALVAVLMGKKDAIQYVRSNYCDRAVESDSQIAFLMKHFGVSSAEGSKAHHRKGGQADSWGGHSHGHRHASHAGKGASHPSPGAIIKNPSSTHGSLLIWGADAEITPV